MMFNYAYVIMFSVRYSGIIRFMTRTTENFTHSKAGRTIPLIHTKIFRGYMEFFAELLRGSYTKKLKNSFKVSM